MRVIVVPYSEDWPRLFREEADEMRRALGDEVMEVHHIGSTSVPGLQAKPVIDLMPVVRDIARVDAYDDAMRALGYEGLGENGIPGRRFFRKGGDERTHNVHVFQVGDPGVERHLAFRAYLVTHPEVAARYGGLKAELARRYPSDIDGYSDGKDAFVKDVERQALAWYRQQHA